MKFIAEIIELKQIKSASLDKVFTVKLRTEDFNIMALSAIPSDCLVEVEILPEGDKKV